MGGENKSKIYVTGGTLVNKEKKILQLRERKKNKNNRGEEQLQEHEIITGEFAYERTDNDKGETIDHRQP